jgi:elongation factor P
VRANDLKPGVAVKMDGRLFVCVKTEHVKPGKGPAYVQGKLRDVASGSYVEKRFGSSDKIEGTSLDRRDMEYLYQDADGFVFMDKEDFDQLTISEEVAGDSMKFLRPNTDCIVLVHEGNPILIELPASVELEVTDTPPGVKSATVTNVFKEATCETGLVTKVPDFINAGETIRVSTADGSYQARA